MDISFSFVMNWILSHSAQVALYVLHWVLNHLTIFVFHHPVVLLALAGGIVALYSFKHLGRFINATLDRLVGLLWQSVGLMAQRLWTWIFRTFRGEPS